MFNPAGAKLTIASVDDPNLSVRAHYNPKELQIDQPIKWEVHESVQAQDIGRQVVEFRGLGLPTAKLELLFDGAEHQGRLQPYGEADATVISQVAKLKQLAATIDPYSSDEDLRRPHFCIVTWGFCGGELSRLRCVIESVSVKYTMFSFDGTPLRAVVTLGIKQADRVARFEEMRQAALRRAASRHLA